MQTETTAASTTRAPVSFIGNLMADLEMHPVWIKAKEAAEALVEVGKAKKKSRFETIVEQKEGGNFFANPTFFKMKDDWNFRRLNSPKFIAGIKVLGAQIAAEGVKTPVKVYNEGTDPTFWLEDGHRRSFGLAYAIVHLDYNPEKLLIPFRMGDKGADDADRLFSQFRDNQSEKPTPFEMARIFSRMVSAGAKKENIAARAGISKSNVIRLLDMATVPEPLQAFTEKDIEVADTFIHKLYEKTGKNTDLAIKALDTAIVVAKDQGYERVMPKHLPADVFEMYNGEKKKRSSKAAPEPEAPAPTPEEDQEQEQEQDQETEGDTDAETEGQDNNPPQDASPETPKTDAQAQPKAQQPAADTTATTNPAKSTAPKGSASAELPVHSAHATAGEKNIKFRAAATEFFKHFVQVSPIDVDNPEADRKLILVKDTITLEMANAILHNLNLD